MEKVKTGFLAFGAEAVESCRRCGRLGTARNYERTLGSFGTFIRHALHSGSEDIPFFKVGPELIVEYEHWLIARGVVRNSTSFYMRNLRSIFNKAVAHGAAKPGNPFRDVYTGIDRTRKRAAGEELIMKLLNMDLHRSPALSLARDLFVFSFCTRGMAFVDIAYLRKSDICDGYISYVRRKTGQRLTVALEPCMERIILRYRGAASGSPYVFPVIMSTDPQTAYEQYRIALNYHNRKLKRLAAMLGEKPSLTTYTARHTWATVARDCNVPLPVISAGMGHMSEKTTQIYLAALDNSVIDRANRGIVGKLNDVVSA